MTLTAVALKAIDACAIERHEEDKEGKKRGEGDEWPLERELFHTLRHFAAARCAQIYPAITIVATKIIPTARASPRFA